MKTALVTGASRGMGLEWVRQLAAQGYVVVLTARTQEKAEQAAASLGEVAGEVWPRKLDLAEPGDVDALVDWLGARTDALDLLVNNAGINSRSRGAIDPSLFLKNLDISHLDSSELLNMVQVNAVAPILLANRLRPLLANSAAPRVINISSWMSSISIKKDGGNYSYAVSKAALNMMNRAFANDVKGDGIVSVVINPGWVQTDMGGQKAPLSKEESVRGMIEVLAALGPADGGEFFNHDGTRHPW